MPTTLPWFSCILSKVTCRETLVSLGILITLWEESKLPYNTWLSGMWVLLQCVFPDDNNWSSGGWFPKGRKRDGWYGWHGWRRNGWYGLLTEQATSSFSTELNHSHCCPIPECSSFRSGPMKKLKMVACCVAYTYKWSFWKNFKGLLLRDTSRVDLQREWHSRIDLVFVTWQVSGLYGEAC